MITAFKRILLIILLILFSSLSSKSCEKIKDKNKKLWIMTLLADHIFMILVAIIYIHFLIL